MKDPGQIVSDILSPDKEEMYATIKRGKIKISIKSKQFKYLMWKHLPLTIVKKHKGHKEYKRLNVK